MTATQTVADLVPPKSPPAVGTDYDDDIRDLGDRIAALSPAEARELEEYLRLQGVST